MTGLAPLAAPVAGAAIEARLREHRADRPLAAPTRLRCSDAHACSRRIALASVGAPRDVELSAEALITFRAGDFYHQLVQEALVATLDARCEVPVDWSPDLSLSGHCDAVYNKQAPVTAVEIKSMAGYGFDLASGAKRSQAGPGPKVEHLVQAGLYALSPQIAAERVHIVYVSKDSSRVAEWIVGVDEPLAHLDGATVRALVDGEVARLRGVLGRLDAGWLPKRYVPGHGVVVDPLAGKDDPEPAPWNCRFCAWRPTCVSLPAGAVRFTQDEARRVVEVEEDVA